MVKGKPVRNHSFLLSLPHLIVNLYANQSCWSVMATLPFKRLTSRCFRLLGTGRGETVEDCELSFLQTERPGKGMARILGNL